MREAVLEVQCIQCRQHSRHPWLCWLAGSVRELPSCLWASKEKLNTVHIFLHHQAGEPQGVCHSIFMTVRLHQGH